MRLVAFTAVAVLAGAAAVPVAGAAPGTAAVGYRAVATRAGPAVVPAGRAGAGWRGGTIDAPGSGAVNRTGISDVSSVWCGSKSGCAAAGNYPDAQGNQGFVVSQEHGVWGREIKVPGLAALNRGGMVLGVRVSCGSAGNCAAGGDYEDRLADSQGFVASEKNGVWGKAIKMGPGLSVAGGFSDVTSVSCGSAGNCAAGGDYLGRRRRAEGFVASERNGVWGKASKVPGLGALNAGGFAEVTSVSCASAGNCAAGGFYTDRADNEQGFVASEKNGVWGKAAEVPGLGALNKGYAEVTSVSCAPIGYCVAGGDYDDRFTHSQGFVASEKNGVWGKATEVPGLGALNAGSDGLVGTKSVSCWSAGNCVAGGDYTDRSGDQLGFVAVEKDGVWGKATGVPGLGALNVGRAAEVVSVSCGAAGNCAAGGAYTDGSGLSQGFVTSQRNGVWGTAVRMPSRGIFAVVESVSCGRAGSCTAGGVCLISLSLGGYGFVVSERHGKWGKPVRLAVPVMAGSQPAARN